MGLFGPYVFKTKKQDKYYLHVKDTGKIKLYYFSKEIVGALPSLPKGYEVFESDKTSLPFLKKSGKKKDDKAKQENSK